MVALIKDRPVSNALCALGIVLWLSTCPSWLFKYHSRSSISNVLFEIFWGHRQRTMTTFPINIRRIITTSDKTCPFPAIQSDKRATRPSGAIPTITASSVIVSSVQRWEVKWLLLLEGTEQQWCVICPCRLGSHQPLRPPLQSGHQRCLYRSNK